VADDALRQGTVLSVWVPRLQVVESTTSGSGFSYSRRSHRSTTSRI